MGDQPSQDEVRIYLAIRKAVGEELARKMFPDVARHLLRIDATERRTTGS